jgi:hypothetical protein
MHRIVDERRMDNLISLVVPSHKNRESTLVSKTFNFYNILGFFNLII